MPLSWNEIKSRALKFSQDWQHEHSEDAEAKSFWDAFFTVFGVTRRASKIAYEYPVKKPDGKTGFIDVFWRNKLIIEHKSKGKDLQKAYQQAKDYCHYLKDYDIPRYLLTCDFAHFKLYDLEQDEQAIAEFNSYGSMPIDDSHLTLTSDEREEALKLEPNIECTIFRYTGGDEFINNKVRWCLWLVNSSPTLLRTSKFLCERIERTKKFRLSSNREATLKLAETPMLFGEIRQPKTQYLLIPKVSSERRLYVPIGLLSSNIIASGSCLIIPDANMYHFGILQSKTHMAWLRIVCGRMKSDYQYSASIVYNNFVWPTPSDKQKTAIEKAAQAVLDARLLYPQSSLADLYDPLTMPPELVKAHQQLDKAVDAAYGQTFKNEAERVAHLFELYQQLTAPLVQVEKGKKRKGA